MLLLIAKKLVKVKFSINDSKATQERDNTNKIATKLKLANVQKRYIETYTNNTNKQLRIE